jgi:4-carboxymuconolactone decarboxylase
MVANYTEEEIKKAHEILFNEGVKMRYQVAGQDYVDAALKKRNDPFAGAMQDVQNTIPTQTPSARLLLTPHSS